MMLPEQTVRDVALLARLGLSEDEIPAFQKDLSSVLDFFSELAAYPLREKAEHSPLRPARLGRSDIAAPAPEAVRQNIRANFPAAKDAYLKVRSVFTA
jgi:aspartyl/glutamyl-tRNA(Asn/Gln) amidotransferase C subunit